MASDQKPPPSRERGASRRRTGILIALVALLAAGAWWEIGRRADGERKSAVAPEVPARTESRAGGPLELAASPTTVAEGSQRAVATEAPATSPAASEADSPLDPSRDRVEVLVIDRELKQTVAGALVHWAGSSEIGRSSMEPRDRPFEAHDVELDLAHARLSRTDEHGVAWVDSRVFPGWIAARKGDRWGSTKALVDMPRPLRIEIAADRGVDFEVVDENDRAVASVPIAVRPDGVGPNRMHVWTGTSGPDGRARWAHVQDRPANESTVFVARLAVLANGLVDVPIDVASLPVEPVRLVLPAWGSVEVVFRDAHDQPILPTRPRLALAGDIDTRGNLTAEALGFAPASIELGRAWFRFVGLGLDLVANEPSGPFESAFTRGAGPRVADEVVTLRLSLGTRTPMLVGRLIDERGEPLRDRDLTTQFFARSKLASRTGSDVARTDHEGRFRIDVGIDAAPDLSGRLSLRPAGVGLGENGSAELTIDAKLQPGDNDVGDVVVRSERVVIEGHVVDDLGAPVERPWIRFSSPRATDGAWEDDARLRVAIEDGGRFAVWSTELPSGVRANVSAPAHAAIEGIDVALDGRDAEIVLPRESIVRGRVWLDAGVEPTSVMVEARRDARSPPFQRAHRVLDKDGRFELHQLPPGRVELLFSIPGMEEVVQPKDLDLRAGETCTDPRLDAIDLRGALVPRGSKRK